MKIAINLASQPFRRDRAMLAASIAVSALLAVTLSGLVYLILTDRAQSADVRQSIARLERRIRKLNDEQSRLAAVLNKPENAEVLELSVFVNKLLYRKGISWTRLLSDLESVLPYNVKLLAIRPTVNAQNEVELDLQIAAQDPLAEINFMKALESAPQFGSLITHQQIPPTQSEPLNRTHLTVTYVQKL